ncbi:MAG: MBL fold metallo-hydrolase [Pseudoalteromonas sp.]|nr:MBL fold metallo-hydrolase [Pseudoalteromonas sp.]
MVKLSLHWNFYWSSFHNQWRHRRTGVMEILFILSSMIIITGCSLNRVYWKPEPEELLTQNANLDESLPLKARFFGTSTILITDDENSILIDGFFSRRSFLGHIFNRMEPDEEMVEVAIKKGNLEKENIRAIYIAHNHFDHSMDTYFVANRLNQSLRYQNNPVIVYGPNEAHSTSKYPEVKTKRAMSDIFGDIKVTVYEGEHAEKSGPLAFLESAFLTLSCSSDYKHAESVYNFLVEKDKFRILIVPSAGVEKHNRNYYGEADIVFLGIGLLDKQDEVFGGSNTSYIETYWNRYVSDTEASIVVPVIPHLIN